MNEILNNLIDEYAPKGSEFRGKLLAFNSVAQGIIEKTKEEARAEMLEKMFFANRKAIEFCSDCKDLKRTLCKKHTILDIYLRDRSGEVKALLPEVKNGV